MLATGMLSKLDKLGLLSELVCGLLKFNPVNERVLGDLLCIIDKSGLTGVSVLKFTNCVARHFYSTGCYSFLCELDKRFKLKCNDKKVSILKYEYGFRSGCISHTIGGEDRYACLLDSFQYTLDELISMVYSCFSCGVISSTSLQLFHGMFEYITQCKEN